MSWKDVRQAIRETVSTDPRSEAPPGWRRTVRETGGTGAIGRALRQLHRPTTTEPLPPDFVALLQALDAADRRDPA